MRIAMFGRVLLVSFGLVAASGAFGQDGSVEVTVTGEGMTRDAARYDAMRKAVERVGENEISSHSKVENFELIRDTVYARAEGIVSDYTVVKWAEGVGGTTHCTIRARVSRSAVATTWGEVQNVLDQLGRPVITVFIQERIDGVIQQSSILESRIERRLLDAGFDVKSGQQVRAIVQRESHDAQTEGNVVKVQAIAKDFGSQIYITGNAQANAAGVKQLAGQAVAMYNCDADIRMFYTDTGRLLASESLPQTRGGARGFFERSPQAGKQALSTTGDALVEQCYVSVMKRWATRITAGGEIVLEIEGMSYGDARKFRRNLEGLDPDKIRSVNFSLTKGIATFRIQAKMTGNGLADALFETDWASGVIEIVDVKTNRIQAKRVGS